MKNNILKLFALLSVLGLLLCGCTDGEKVPTESGDSSGAPSDTARSGLETDPTVPDPMAVLRENMPKTDGSTSTLPLDIAVRAAILGISREEAAVGVAHSKTYESLNNLTRGECELIIRTPLSHDEIEFMESVDFDYTALPVSSEGFVFVVNAENPVDTLTATQLRDIYSGKITNWSELGGEDIPIIPYQRNRDSGSQNYMLDFMGDTPLMEPITDAIPGTMAGILDAIANYENGAGALGYSVYAFSDGMYEDMAKIKYIKVDGVAPSYTTIADGSYPLIGYNYAVFSSALPESSPVRTFVSFMQSDEGQQAIADAGYAPYRYVEGLRLPQMSQSPLYSAVGSGGEVSDADYFYGAVFSEGENNTEFDLSNFPAFENKELDRTLKDYLSAQKARLEAIPDSEIENFMSSRIYECFNMGRVIYMRMINRCVSVESGVRYAYGVQDSPDFFYKAETAVFDGVTGERLELSDLFPEGCDFVPMLNDYLDEMSAKPYSGFGNTYELLKTYDGLREGEFHFAADRIIFDAGRIFADGAIIRLDGLKESMSIWEPYDVKEMITDGHDRVHAFLPTRLKDELGEPAVYPTGTEAYGKITIWLLDSEKTGISKDVCDKLNRRLTDFYERSLTPEKLLDTIKKNGIAESDIKEYSVCVWGDFYYQIYGKRYLMYTGADYIFVTLNDGETEQIELQMPGRAYFDASTGEEIDFPESLYEFEKYWY